MKTDDILKINHEREIRDGEVIDWEGDGELSVII